MNLVEKFYEALKLKAGLVSYLEKETGIEFTRINAGLRDENFTEEEREKVDAAITKWININRKINMNQAELF